MAARGGVAAVARRPRAGRRAGRRPPATASRLRCRSASAHVIHRVVARVRAGRPSTTIATGSSSAVATAPREHEARAGERRGVRDPDGRLGGRRAGERGQHRPRVAERFEHAGEQHRRGRAGEPGEQPQRLAGFAQPRRQQEQAGRQHDHDREQLAQRAEQQPQRRRPEPARRCRADAHAPCRARDREPEIAQPVRTAQKPGDGGRRAARCAGTAPSVQRTVGSMISSTPVPAPIAVARRRGSSARRCPRDGSSGGRSAASGGEHHRAPRRPPAPRSARARRAAPPW